MASVLLWLCQIMESGDLCSLIGLLVVAFAIGIYVGVSLAQHFCYRRGVYDASLEHYRIQNHSHISRK